jgi:osmotically inducible lipoprotein OsmB
MTHFRSRSDTMNRKFLLAAGLGGVLVLSGCAGMSETEQRVMSGAGIGTAGGAVVGAITGDWAWAAAGAAVGAAGGYLVDQNKKKQEQAYQQGYKAGQTQK